MLVRHIVRRHQELVIQVRSPGGKLLFVKTPRGYEFKCPRTKEIYLVGYDEIIIDCLRFGEQADA